MRELTKEDTKARSMRGISFCKHLATLNRTLGTGSEVIRLMTGTKRDCSTSTGTASPTSCVAIKPLKRLVKFAFAVAAANCSTQAQHET